MQAKVNMRASVAVRSRRRDSDLLRDVFSLGCEISPIDHYDLLFCGTFLREEFSLL